MGGPIISGRTPQWHRTHWGTGPNYMIMCYVSSTCCSSMSVNHIHLLVDVNSGGRSTHLLGKCPWTGVHGLVSITKQSGPPSRDVWWPNCWPMAHHLLFHVAILPPFHATMPTHATSLTAQDRAPLHHHTMPPLPALTSSSNILFLICGDTMTYRVVVRATLRRGHSYTKILRDRGEPNRRDTLTQW